MTESYDDRLFKGRNLRSYLHNSRFLWFQRKLEDLKVGAVDVIEVGCFDGRLLKFFPNPPRLYHGLDAGWEGGLERAQVKFTGHESRKFELAHDSSALHKYPDGRFQLGASMETIEHIPPDLVAGYFAELSRVVDGYVFITVPNEKGIVFLAKWLAKKVFLSSAERYSFSELVAATLGRMDRVERNEHKGFDYARLVDEMSKHFTIQSVEGIPFRLLPKFLSFTIGIVALSKRT